MAAKVCMSVNLVQMALIREAVVVAGSAGTIPKIVLRSRYRQPSATNLNLDQRVTLVAMINFDRWLSAAV